ncbi:thiolase family protein, partial [Pseudomonas sp. GW456-R21]
MEPIYIAGIAMTEFGRHLERSLQDLALEALQGALADAGAQRSDIGAVFYAGITNGKLQGQLSIPGQVICSKIGIEGVPIYNVENACASGSTAVHLAVQSLRAGATDVVLALGAEKMNVPDKLRALSLFETGWDVSTAEENYATLVKMGEGIVPPPGSESDRPYSKFMAIYAAMCRWHMKTYGTTQRQIAAVCAKNHQHSVHNPYSQFRKTFTIEEVLAAPPITYPITLPMCAPLSDGSAAAILCTEAGLKRIGADPKRCVRIAASVIRSFTLRGLDEPHKHVSLLAAREAYEIAGLGPQDMHVAEVHDASAMGEIIQSENLGLAPLGEGGICA